MQEALAGNCLEAVAAEEVLAAGAERSTILVAAVAVEDVRSTLVVEAAVAVEFVAVVDHAAGAAAAAAFDRCGH